MRTQPAHDGGRFPIGQHLDRTMGLQIDQERAVAVPFFPGEIVQSQHVWGLSLGDRRAANEPQQRLAAGGHREALRQLRTCFASVSKRDLGKGLGLSQRAPGVVARHLGKRSAKVVRGQPRVRHTKRRTSRRTRTARP